jgi:hypothetical protein
MWRGGGGVICMSSWQIGGSCSRRCNGSVMLLVLLELYGNCALLWKGTHEIKIFVTYFSVIFVLPNLVEVLHMLLEIKQTREGHRL